METLLHHAIDNDNNESIASLTYDIIEKRKMKILKELPNTLILKEKLKEYRHVDELPEFRLGCFIRWINLSNPAKLMNGGILLKIDVETNGTILRCKNKYMFSVRVDDCFIFQKITQQEHVILSVIDYIQ